MTDQQALREYALSQNAEAFRVLVEQYQRLVYSAASRRLAHAHDIDDVVQLTFLKLAKAAGTIHRDLAAWLYTTTLNTANDVIRRDQTRRRHEALAAPAESAMGNRASEELHTLSLLIDEILLELPQPQQSLIVEHFFHGRSQRDLAEELHVSQPTILRRINVAIDDLRQRLAAHGYTAAAPALASALGNLPQPPVPTTLTTQLAKIGLSGVSTHAITPSLWFARPLWIKLALGAMGIMALLAVPILLFRLPPAVRSAGAGSVRPTNATTAAPTALPNWRTTFENAYALQPNQNLKFIPPPPLPERQRYLLEVENNDSPMPFIQWRWINGTLKRQWMQGNGPAGASLLSVLKFCANLDAHHISLVNLPAINANGDWIVRDGATTEAILTDLRTILLQQFKTDVRSEKIEVVKNALIATGNYHLRRIPDATVGDLQIYTDVLDHPQPGEEIAGGGISDPAEFWSMMGEYLGIPIVDEATNEPDKIDWLLSYSFFRDSKEPAVRQQILDNITKQTGLAFKQDKRIFTTWKLTSVPSKNPHGH
jgi:RNA polymerase sigma factor (sigma-70 family)